MPKQTQGLSTATPEDSDIGTKLGGVADVHPQLRAELTKTYGLNVTPVPSSYRNAKLIEAAKFARDFESPSSRKPQRGSLLCEPVNGNLPADLILDCESFASPAGTVYVHNPAGQPSETDGATFAVFSSMVAQCIEDEAFRPCSKCARNFDVDSLSMERRS